MKVGDRVVVKSLKFSYRGQIPDSCLGATGIICSLEYGGRFNVVMDDDLNMIGKHFGPSIFGEWMFPGSCLELFAPGIFDRKLYKYDIDRRIW